MALNFLGLGFSLGAEDKGLGKAIKDTSSGLADISKSVVGIGLASAKMVLTPPKFGPSVALAQTLANDIKLTTTGIEAFGVAASKATSAGLAGLNLTEKEFKAAQGMISSTAFSMNTDVGAVTKSFTALKQSAVDVRKIGFNSFQDYQKFIEVTGTDSVAFAAAIGTMNKQMGMTDDEVKGSIKAVAAIGRKFNIGREAVAGMAETVKVLNANSNLLPQNWSPAKMGKFLKGTTVVAGALTSVGISADEAMTASRKLTEKLLEGSKGIAGLYSGVVKDLPDVYQVVTENLGDMESAFKMLSESPDQFILKMGTVVDKVNKMNLDPKNMDRFRLQMEQTFGPDVMATFTKAGFGKIGPAIKKANEPIKGQDDILKDLSKRYQDGRTMAERFAIAQDMVQTKLKQVHGVMSDSKFLAAYNAQSKDFLRTVNHLADKGGALGKLTTSLIEVKNRGFGGFLAAHSKFGFALAEGLKLIGPMLQYLPALAIAFKALFSPITLVAGAIAGLFFLFKDLGKGEKSVIRPWINNVIKEAPAFWAKVKDVFSAVFDVIVGVFKQINWAKVGNVIGELLGKAVNLAFDLAFAAVDLLGRLIDWFTGLDWGKIGNYLGKAIVGLFALAVDLIWTVIKRIPDMFVAIVKLVIGVLSGIEDTLKEKFPEWSTAIGVFFAALKVVAIPILVALGVHFTLLAAKAVYAAVTTAAAWVKASYQQVAATMRIIAVQTLYYTTVAAMHLKTIADWVATGFAAAKAGAIQVAQWAASGLAAVKSAALTVASYIAMGAAAMASAIKVAAAWVIALGPIAWIVAAVVGLGLVIYKFGDKIKSFLSGVWDSIKGAAKAAWEGIKKFVMAPIEGIKAAWGAITGFFGGLWDSIKGGVGSAWDWIKGKASGAWNGIKNVVGAGGVSAAVQKELDAVKVKTEQLSKDTAKSAQDAMTSVKGTSVGVKVVAVDSAQMASTATVDANIKTAKMVTDYVNTTDKHLKKAADLVFPKISGDPMNELTQKYRDSYSQIEDINLQIANLQADNAKQAVDSQGKILQGVYKIDKETANSVDKLKDKISDIRADMVGQDKDAIKQFEFSAQAMDSTIHKTRQLFAGLGEQMKKMNVEDRDLFRGRIDAATSYYAKEEIGLARKIYLTEQAGQDASKYQKQLEASNAERDKELKALGVEIAAYANGAKGIISDWGKASRAEIDATTKMMIDKFTIASTEMAKRWSAAGPAGQEISRGFAEIDKGYASAILNLKNQSGLVGAALEKEIAAVTKKYGEQRKVLSDEVLKYGSDLKSANKTVQDAVADSLKGTIDKIQDNLKKGNKAVAESAKIVSQEFKLSGAEAADAVGKIAVIDPNAFRTNIRVVRNETMAFLQKLDVEAQKLVKNTDKSINTFWEHSKKGWNDQEALIKTFSDKAVAHTEKYWTKVLDEASRATIAFEGLFKSIQSRLVSMAKSVNVMDLLASPSQISQWAASVVAALAYAFRTGGAVDALIMSSYNKALASSLEMSRAGSATPDTAGVTSPAAPATSQQAMLLNAINRPTWATEEKQLIPAQLIAMNEQLKQTLAQLRALAETKSAGRAGGKSISPKS